MILQLLVVRAHLCRPGSLEMQTSFCSPGSKNSCCAYLTEIFGEMKIQVVHFGFPAKSSKPPGRETFIRGLRHRSPGPWVGLGTAGIQAAGTVNQTNLVSASVAV